VLHVLEVLAALVDTGAPTEVVDRDRGIAALREAQRQLLVEVVEAADVGEDHHADRDRLLGGGGEGREAVAVGGFEHHVLVRDGGAGDDCDRRL